MGKLVVTEFITLDGIIEDPGGSEGTEHGGWSFRHPAPEGQQFKGEELERADAQLLGRVTYQGFAAGFLHRRPGGEFAKKMNAMPKYVVSTTLTDATWTNTTILRGTDLAAEVTRVKDQYQGDILVAGSAALVHSLAELGLVDEYRLMVHPVVLGTGKRLFASAGPDLELAETRKGGPDVLLLIYRPAKSAAD